jgi:hypothetical protein
MSHGLAYKLRMLSFITTVSSPPTITMVQNLWKTHTEIAWEPVFITFTKSIKNQNKPLVAPSHHLNRTTARPDNQSVGMGHAQCSSDPDAPSAAARRWRRTSNGHLRREIQEIFLTGCFCPEPRFSLSHFIHVPVQYVIHSTHGVEWLPEDNKYPFITSTEEFVSPKQSQVLYSPLDCTT